MSYPSFSDISRSFVPGWFAAVMGRRRQGQRWPICGQAAGGQCQNAASLRLHQALGWNGVFAIAVAACLLLVGVWALTLLRTLSGVASGVIFQPHR